MIRVPSQNVHKQSAGQATKEYISVVRADAEAIRALQCLHLLAWPINSLVAEWAPVGLRERGAYLRYQSELQAGDPAAHAAMAAALANGTLRADAAEAAAMRARAGRAGDAAAVDEDDEEGEAGWREPSVQPRSDDDAEADERRRHGAARPPARVR